MSLSPLSILCSLSYCYSPLSILASDWPGHVTWPHYWALTGRGFPPTWPGLRADPKLVTGPELTPTSDNTQSLSVLLLGWSHRKTENTHPRSVSQCIMVSSDKWARIVRIGKLWMVDGVVQSIERSLCHHVPAQDVSLCQPLDNCPMWLVSVTSLAPHLRGHEL